MKSAWFKDVPIVKLMFLFVKYEGEREREFYDFMIEIRETEKKRNREGREIEEGIRGRRERRRRREVMVVMVEEKKRIASK